MYLWAADNFNHFIRHALSYERHLSLLWWGKKKGSWEEKMNHTALFTAHRCLGYNVFRHVFIFCNVVANMALKSNNQKEAEWDNSNHFIHIPSSKVNGHLKWCVMARCGPVHCGCMTNRAYKKGWRRFQVSSLPLVASKFGDSKLTTFQWKWLQIPCYSAWRQNNKNQNTIHSVRPPLYVKAHIFFV